MSVQAKLSRMDTPVKVRLTLELETNGQTHAEELGWILNMLRFELAHWPRWTGKIRRVEMLSSPPGRVDPAGAQK